MIKQKILGCFIGGAIGDAIGAQVEFKKRGSYSPVTDMVGGGPFNLKPGQWTDDTSMTLCLAMSLIESQKFDPFDQMNKFIKWRKEGYLSSTGYCFDIGNTIEKALINFKRTKNPYSGLTDEFSSGNGSLMRIAPITLFYFPELSKIIEYSGLHSKLTHDTIESIEACQLFSIILNDVMKGNKKNEIIKKRYPNYFNSEKIQKIANCEYINKNENDIVGNGYVINTLESVLWSFNKTSTFEEAILTLVNLGDDSDTTASICGSLAGAYYGYDAIPKKWINAISMKEMIFDIAQSFIKNKNKFE